MNKNECSDSNAAENFSSTDPIPKNAKRKADEADLIFDDDLLCITCHDLVIDATQTACCGSLFCRSCITTWIAASDSCPTCRSSLQLKNLITDVRSDRKSASQPRCCKQKEYGCEYIGSRNEMVEHEKSCKFIPITFLEQQSHELSAELSEAKQKIVTLTAELADAKVLATADSRLSQKALQQCQNLLTKSLKTAGFQEPYLKKVNNLNVVKVFPLDPNPNMKHRFFYTNAEEEYCIRISIGMRYVSLSLYCDTRIVKAHTEDVGFVLIHPDGQHLNRKIRLSADFVERGRLGCSYDEWMTAAEFVGFCRAEAFACGVY